MKKRITRASPPRGFSPVYNTGRNERQCSKSWFILFYFFIFFLSSAEGNLRRIAWSSSSDCCCCCCCLFWSNLHYLTGRNGFSTQKVTGAFSRDVAEDGAAQRRSCNRLLLSAARLVVKQFVLMKLCWTSERRWTVYDASRLEVALFSFFFLSFLFSFSFFSHRITAPHTSDDYELYIGRVSLGWSFKVGVFGVRRPRLPGTPAAPLGPGPQPLPGPQSARCRGPRSARRALRGRSILVRPLAGLPALPRSGELASSRDLPALPARRPRRRAGTHEARRHW